MTSASGPAPWKQYTFFNGSEIHDASDATTSPDVFKVPPEIATIVSSISGPLMADIHGSIHLLSKDFEIARSWVAHVGGRVSHMVARGDLLVTVGEEGGSSSVGYAPVLKVWDLHRKDKKTGAPNLLRSVKVRSGGRPHPISAIALSKKVNHFAIGLADGTVLLYRNIDQSIAGSSSLTSLPKPKIIHESPTEPITGLGFRDSLSDDSTPACHLFIVTTNRVLCFHVSGKGSGAAPYVVDEVGCGLGCAVMDNKENEILIARDEAIYICGVDGRGPSHAYEGNKSSVHTFLNYVVIVSPPLSPTASSTSATIRKHVAGNPGTTEVTKLTIFDLANKIVAYSGTYSEGIREVFEGWGELFVLGNDGKLLHLEEKPTQEKLDILYEKRLYTLAIGLAKSQNLEESVVADIHRQYGDYLYSSRSDFGGAMQQYLQTIGYLQPSYVIRKYLDAQRIQNLTTYLQELHSMGLANSDHTTLLLNAYTKLKDNAKLDSFIKSESHKPRSEGGEDDGQPPFDLDTVIRVCRQAGYFDHAAYLAKKYQRHDDYLRIIIEDKADYGEALVYFRSSKSESAITSLTRYGRSMLVHLPEETTSFLIELCTGTVGDLPAEAGAQINRVNGAGPSYFSYLAIGKSQESATADKDADLPKAAPATREPSRSGEPPTSAAPGPKTVVKAPTQSEPENLPSLRPFFAHFVAHHAYFVRFLEEVALKRWGQTLEQLGSQDQTSDVEYEPSEKAEQAAVWNTLLELYLTPSGGAPPREDKALTLLSSTLPYDQSHALILCTLRSFEPGQVLIWERLGMHADILRYFMRSNPPRPDAVLERLETYGPTHPELYPLVLRYLTSSAELLSKHTEDVKMVLSYIEQNRILQPIEVVQILSRNNNASVGLVQAWLMERIKEGREEIDKNNALIDSYRTETKQKEAQIAALRDPSQPKVFHNTRCATCGAQLDLPAVHFMCGHSYHQRCLPDNNSSCTACFRANGVISEIRRNNARLAGQADVFLGEVDEGGWESLAEAFGRGWIGPPSGLGDS